MSEDDKRYWLGILLVIFVAGFVLIGIGKLGAERTSLEPTTRESR